VTVALLGTGIMGKGMAKNIAKAGIPIRVWNRTRVHAEPLAEHGITIADTAVEAVEGADVVITILFDTDSVEAVIKDVTLPPNAVWLQMSTVGIEGTKRLAALSNRYVDAPVLGTLPAAEAGKLMIMASGQEALRDKANSVFDAVGSRTMWVGDEPGPASKLKLVLNGWMQCVLAGTAQSIAFAESVGLDPRLFLEGIAGTAADSLTAQFSLDGLAKDIDLIIDGMRSGGVDASILENVMTLTRRAQQQGHGDEDIAAIYYGFRPDR
jgi:3-hydroxyisobutyrate dehydrogenase